MWSIDTKVEERFFDSSWGVCLWNMSKTRGFSSQLSCGKCKLPWEEHLVLSQVLPFCVSVHNISHQVNSGWPMTFVFQGSCLRTLLFSVKAPVEMLFLNKLFPMYLDVFKPVIYILVLKLGIYFCDINGNIFSVVLGIIFTSTLLIWSSVTW